MAIDSFRSNGQNVAEEVRTSTSRTSYEIMTVGGRRGWQSARSRLTTVFCRLVCNFFSNFLKTTVIPCRVRKAQLRSHVSHFTPTFIRFVEHWDVILPVSVTSLFSEKSTGCLQFLLPLFLPFFLYLFLFLPFLSLYFCC